MFALTFNLATSYKISSADQLHRDMLPQITPFDKNLLQLGAKNKAKWGWGWVDWTKKKA